MVKNGNPGVLFSSPVREIHRLREMNKTKMMGPKLQELDGGVGGENPLSTALPA